MIRPDYLIFGYRYIEINENDKKRVIQIFLKNNISVKFDGNRFAVKESDFNKVRKLLLPHVSFQASKLRGMLGFICANRKRVGVIAAILISFVLTLLSSDFVWDVRVEGCESGNEEKIISELAQAGLSVGSRWHNTDKSKVEINLLSNSEYVSWVNINRRGNVAYVNVIDKIVKEEPQIKSGYSNLVAACDAVIEEITVVCGVAMVKAGDTVREGQLLISGILPSESGGGFCYAEGIVLAKTNDFIEVKVSENVQEKVKSEKKTSRIAVNILGFEINIFKSYRNFNKEYDIIKKKDTLKFFGTEIPISLVREYIEPYEFEDSKLTCDEMTEKAMSEIKALLAERTSNATLLRIKSQGEFRNEEYVLRSDFTVIENIGKDLAFEVHQKP